MKMESYFDLRCFSEEKPYKTRIMDIGLANKKDNGISFKSALEFQVFYLFSEIIEYQVNR